MNLYENLCIVTSNMRITLISFFPRGRYDLWPNKEREELSEASVAFDIRDRSGVCIDGQGSEFVFHGKMMPFSVLNAVEILLSRMDKPRIR